MEPYTNVGTNHVHEAKASDKLVSSDDDSGVHEDKVQLDEGEDHVGAGRQAVHEGVAVFFRFKFKKLTKF